MANGIGIEKEQAEKHLIELEDKNLVLRMPTVEKYIFIHPERVTGHLIDVLDPDNTRTQDKIKTNFKILKQSLEEKEKLDELKASIEKKASESTTRVLWGFAGVAIFTRCCNWSFNLVGSLLGYYGTCHIFAHF